MESVAAMSRVIDDRGRLYRPGGDEFCIILPNRSGPDAAVDAELVRLSIDRLKPFGGTSKVTGSIGVATSCAKLTDARALIAAADDAMYVSKWTTKNCVTTWPPSDSARIRADLAKLNSRVALLQAQIAAQDKRNTDEKQRRQQGNFASEDRGSLSISVSRCGGREGDNASHRRSCNQQKSDLFQRRPPCQALEQPGMLLPRQHLFLSALVFGIMVHNE
jgi:hypothetical protein